MQYYSLQHQTLLLTPDTSTTKRRFDLAQSLHSFWSYFWPLPQYHIRHLLTWGAQVSPPGMISWYHIFLPFHDVHGVLKARIVKWFAILLSSGLHFVRILHHEPSTLGGHAKPGP